MFGPSPLTFDSGPTAPESGATQENGARVYLAERAIAQTQAVHDAGGKVFDHHVTLACELARQFLALVRGEIQRYPQLAEVDSVPDGGPVYHPGFPSALAFDASRLNSMRAADSTRTTSAPHCAEPGAGVRRGVEPPEVQNPDTFERQFAGRAVTARTRLMQIDANCRSGLVETSPHRCLPAWARGGVVGV